MNYDHILENSLKLSRPYWELYEQLIYNRHHKPSDADLEEEISVIDDEDDDDGDVALELDDTDRDATLNAEYLEFIKVTREHQAKRERDKRLRQRRGLDVEAYYKDISQVDTLVEDNLVEAPEKGGDYCSQGVSVKQKELDLIDFYGGCDAYESIRSTEMIIDEFFQKKCRELKPNYWPVMPINPRRYLNPIVR